MNEKETSEREMTERQKKALEASRKFDPWGDNNDE